MPFHVWFFIHLYSSFQPSYHIVWFISLSVASELLVFNCYQRLSRRCLGGGKCREDGAVSRIQGVLLGLFHMSPTVDDCHLLDFSLIFFWLICFCNFSFVSTLDKATARHFWVCLTQSLTKVCGCVAWIKYLIICIVFNWFQASVDESNSLRSLVTKKEAEIEKYKKYLEKAKTVSTAV